MYGKRTGDIFMRYYLWNTRYSIDKEKSVITYADGTIGKKTWQMIPSIPAGAKFTAKKNYASSMQSHKRVLPILCMIFINKWDSPMRLWIQKI